MSSPSKLRREVSDLSLTLHARGWVANHDGNVSARHGDGFLITPTAVSKRLCDPDSIVACDGAGKPSRRGRPPSEVALHVAAYARGDVNAVVHAHPVHASAFALARRALGPVEMPEVVVSLGDQIPLVPLFLPKDEGVGPALAHALAGANAVLLAGNGALTVGPDLQTAFLRMELLEHYAQICSVLSGGVGAAVPLTSQERARLLEMRKKAGLHLEAPAPKSGAPDLRAVVAEEVRRVFGGQK